MEFNAKKYLQILQKIQNLFLTLSFLSSPI